jgi:hypothetical protein
MTDLKEIREAFLEKLENDEGLLIGYQANVAMLLHDKYGIKDRDKRNEAAIAILNLIFGGDLKRVD